MRSRDEVGELAAAVNAMAQRLETGLERERELDAARIDLMRAVSHDLRTPLASIRAMVESINDGVVDDPATVARYLRSTETQVTSMTQLIDDLLELSQMDAGALTLQAEPASIADLISDTIESMTARAAAQGLQLDGQVAEGLPHVMMDARRVQRVLNNLVHNAITHTPPRAPSFSAPGTRGPRSRWTSSTPATGCPRRNSPASWRPLPEPTDTWRPAPRHPGWGSASSSPWSGLTAAASGWRAPPAGAVSSASPCPRPTPAQRHRERTKRFPMNAAGRPLPDRARRSPSAPSTTTPPRRHRLQRRQFGARSAVRDHSLRNR